MKNSFVTLIFCISFFPFLTAQEICNNGIDDDGDNWIDQNDCDCEVGPASLRGNVWHFGEGFVVDFNSGAPEVLAPSPMETFEGSATICTEEGELLFFSNGGGRLVDILQETGKIWNADYEVMYDMLGTEGGGFSAGQSCVIVPRPASLNRHYLFTMEESEFDIDGTLPDQTQGRGLSYFEIDMSLNGGLGGVSVADQRLFVPSYEALAAIEHANEEDYWVIIDNADNPEREFVVFLATADSIQLSGSYTFPSPDDAISIIKISPIKNRIIVGGSNQISIYDFDPATGIISAETNVSWESYAFGDFSPSGRYFYGMGSNFSGGMNTISRIDLTAASPSLEEVAMVENGISMGLFSAYWQLAPDGNIYYRAGGPFLGVVQCPDSPCPTVIHNFLELEGNPNSVFSTISVGIPNFPNNYFARPPYEEVEITSPSLFESCNGETIDIFVETNKCVTFEWENGATTSSIPVTEAGTYLVTLTDECCDTEHAITVAGDGVPNFTTDAPSFVCTGESINISVENAPPDLMVNWSDLAGNMLAEGTLETTIISDTIFLLEVLTDCGTFTDQINIGAIATPMIDLNIEAALCGTANGSASLNMTQTNWDISWTDESGTIISEQNTVDNLTPGNYRVEVVNVVNGISCAISEEFSVEESGTPEILLLSILDNSCPNLNEGQIEVEISAGSPPYQIEWVNADGSLIGTTPLLNDLTNGTYAISVIDANGCVAEDVFSITNAPLSTYELIVTNATCDGNNGAIELSPSLATGEQLFVNGIFNPSSQLDNLLAGNYDLLLTNSSACILLDTMITVENVFPFQLDADTSIIITEGERLSLNFSFINQEVAVNWIPSDFLSCDDCLSPIASPPSSSTYTLQLLELETGCIEEVQVTIIVEPRPQIYIPNVFSPNDDGFNDEFQVFFSDSRTQVASMKIFDRWGALVFEEEGDAARWDGKFKGEFLNPGIFVYFIELVFPNGNRVERRGDVLLAK